MPLAQPAPGTPLAQGATPAAATPLPPPGPAATSATPAESATSPPLAPPALGAPPQPLVPLSPIAPPTPPAPACEALALQDATPDQLLPHLQRCQRSSAYLARLGHQLNRLQRYPEAVEHLERAILFDPDATTTQMDYAIALAGSGDTLSALQLIAALLARNDLPADQRVALQATRAHWAQALHTHVQHTRLQAGLRWGWDNNLLGAPNLTSLTLTFPSEAIQLPLDESNRPRPGGYQRADLRLDHTVVQPSGTRWDMGVALLQRHSAAVPESGSRQAEFVVERSQASHYLAASGAWLATRSGTRYRNLGAAAGLQWPQAGAQGRACQTRLGLEAQDRSLASNALLSGRYMGLVAQWQCAGLPGAAPAAADGAAASAPQWRVQLRTGRDTPQQTQRPGGPQLESSLRATLSLPTRTTSAWLLDGELSHTRDSTGYSPLLDRGAVRRQTRGSLRLEYQHTWRPGLQWLAGAEAVAQASNLPLFSLHSRGLYVGLRGTW